jgi:hypothetical protein
MGVDMSINLLEETLYKLREHRKTPEDVLFCMIEPDNSYKDQTEEAVYFSWDAFVSMVDREYDNGYGIECVDTGLKVVGADFWLERATYDGSEWWVYKCLPVRPETEVKVPKIFCY